MIRKLTPILALLVAGCADWPDIPESEGESQGEWPTLVPVESVTPPPPLEDEVSAQQDLLDRAERLQTKADILRRPVADDAAMERLRQSLSG